MTMSFETKCAASVVADLFQLPPRRRVHFYDLMAVLRQPEALFGEPSERLVDLEPDHMPVNWDELLDVAQEAAMDHGMTATTMMEILQVAADVLRESGLRICAGNPERVDIYPAEMEEAGFSYDLRLDATHQVARALTDNFIGRLIDRDMCRRGFMFSFVGEWTEEELDDWERAAEAAEQGGRHGRDEQ
ncbi:hypothetical protein [Mitsuaria sp. GD03876]|uniref:hypothetical protein n=1 Tax=Mitsuaria sp. GD03876 TaxID=2975399 RepID=UPI00244B371D|nr:hypothetical protein [Mitsuaria sp. GD03876]MDH0866798.1 hypothetical protein [Mitsuaria sp. GD03876]